MYVTSPQWKTSIRELSRVFDVEIILQTAFENFVLGVNDIDAGSMIVNEGVTDGADFSVGCAYKDDFSVTLANADGRFDEVQLNGSIVRPSVGLKLPSGEYEYVPLGVFVVDEVKAQYAADGQATRITINAFNLMVKFEVPFSRVSASFPCTTKQLLTMICQHCGVPLGTSSFLNDDYTITERPEEDYSCRDIVACIAEIAGSWARVDRQGFLEINWFKNPTPVQEANLDGGTVTSEPITQSGSTITLEDVPIGKELSSLMLYGATNQTVTEQGKNLFDGLFYNGDWNGGVVPVAHVTSTSRKSSLNFITVIPSTQYVISWSSSAHQISVIFCDTNKSKLSDSAWSNSGATFTTPTACKYIAIRLRRTDGTDITLSEAQAAFALLQVEAGSTPTPYAPFVPQSSSPDYPAPITGAQPTKVTVGDTSYALSIAAPLHSLPDGTIDEYDVISGTVTRRIKTVTMSSGTAINIPDAEPNSVVRCTHCPPTALVGTTLTIASGITSPATIYYRLAAQIVEHLTPRQIPLLSPVSVIANDVGADMVASYTSVAREDSADGGTFGGIEGRTYDGGLFVVDEPIAEYDFMNRYDFRIDDAPVRITGVRLERDEGILLAGSPRSAITITDNPLIQDDAEEIVASMWNKLKSFSFLPFTSNWQGDPAIQAGDMITQTDRKGRTYRTLVTQSTFTLGGKPLLYAGGKSEVASGYVDPLNRAVSRITSKLRDKQVQIDAMDVAVKNGTAMLVNALGGTVVNGADVGFPGEVFFSDNPDIHTATHVWRYNVAGWGHSSNGLAGPYQMGATADNSMWANLITANMIRVGLLQSLNGKSWLNLDNGKFSLGDGSLVFDGTTFKAISAEKLTDAVAAAYATIGSFVVEGVPVDGLRLSSSAGFDILRMFNFGGAIVQSPGNLTLASNGDAGNPNYLGLVLQGGNLYVHVAGGAMYGGYSGDRNGVRYRNGIAIGIV